MEKRPIAIMGDGGFWHNGLITGVASNLFNKGDGVLIVMQNGYASATGQQYIPSSVTSRDGPTPGVDIEQTLRIMGVKWLRTVRTYSVSVMVKTLKEAMRTAERGLKVIIADGECQLARQRRVRAEDAVKLERGERVTRTRYGVDDEICTGDHSCIRLSGCPSLTVKPSIDPLRTDPVATVIEVLRRLRPVRRGCACRRVVPIVLPRRDRAQRHLARSRAVPLQAEGHRLARRLWRRDRRESRIMSATRPITLLIAALGGEGGGVLTDWIVSATAEAGFPVQSTSIPGVAQRTGATTYYIEIFPALARELGGKRPVLALTPGVGDIDIAVASEMLEAGRMVANGFVTPERTHLIASLSRFYAMDEKIAMGDGRFDQDKLIKTVKDNARDALLIDMDALAKQSGSIINAVMLGAIAGSQAAAADGRAIRSRDPRRRQIGRQQFARLPRRA